MQVKDNEVYSLNIDRSECLKIILASTLSTAYYSFESAIALSNVKSNHLILFTTRLTIQPITNSKTRRF